MHGRWCRERYCPPKSWDRRCGERASAPRNNGTARSHCRKAAVLVEVESGSVRRTQSSLAGRGTKTGGGEDMTPKCRKRLMKASRISHDAGEDVIGSEHILQALLTEECVAKRIIEMEGASPDGVRPSSRNISSGQRRRDAHTPQDKAL